jgi:hypothetical protein
MHLFIAHGFLSLDIGNENHIGVPVINLCHNKNNIIYYFEGVAQVHMTDIVFL